MLRKFLKLALAGEGTKMDLTQAELGFGSAARSPNPLSDAHFVPIVG
jgi:hypothetical protein